MMESLTVPRHQVLSEGRFFPFSNSPIRNHTPKQIDYRHTIRVITPFFCTHEEEIKRIETLHHEQMRLKDEEIQSLRVVINEKDKEIEAKDREIEALKESSKKQLSLMKASLIEMEGKLEGSQVTEMFFSNVKSQTDHGCFSNIKKSFIYDLGAEQHSSRELNRVDTQFQNLENSLKELGNVLKKPKKYQFFTRPNLESVVSLPQKSQKLETKPDLAGQEFLEDVESLSATSANQSFDASDFLEETIQQHHVLRDTLIELEKSTQAEMQQLKEHYEHEIEEYRRMLQKEKDKGKAVQGLQLRDSGKEREEHKNRQEQFKRFLKRPGDEVSECNHLDND